MKKRLFIGSVVLVLLLSSVAIAAGTTKTIKVVYDNIKIIIDDVEQKPSQQPFIYNGVVYAPVDFIAGKLGKKTTYQSSTKKIFISNTGKAVKEYKEQLLYRKPYIDTNAEVRAEDNSYNNGKATYADLSFSKVYDKGKYYIIYPLNGQAKNLKAKIGLYDESYYPDDAVFTIYDENNKVLYRSLKITDKMDFVDVDIDVTGVLQVKLEVDRLEDDGNYFTPVFRDLKVLTTDY